MSQGSGQGGGQANSGGGARAADDFGPPPSDDFDDDIPVLAWPEAARSSRCERSFLKGNATR